MLSRRDRIWMLGLLAAALALRVAWVLAVQRRGLPFNDVFFYDRVATSLAAGDGYRLFDEPTSRWPPVYPLLLAAIYWAFGPGATGGELLNAGAGALAAPLAYVCALRLFGRREAAIAGVLTAAFPGQVILTDALLAETVYATLLLGVLALCLVLPRERWWAALAVGLAIGVAAETRGEGLMLLILPLAIWWRPPLRQAAVVALGVAVVVGAWTARNAVEMDAFVPSSTNGAQTFWSGHNPDAHGGPTYSFGPGSATARAARRTSSPRELELAQARELREEALDWMASHPLDELRLIPHKLAYLMRGDSTLLELWVQTGGRGTPDPIGGRTASAIGVVADVCLYALVALTLLAAGWCRRNRPLAPGVRALWLLIAAALVLYGFVLYGNPRYRLPLEPVMILLAAPVLARTRTILPRQWTSAPSPSA